MDILAIPTIGFIVVLLGIVFLFGEILVRTKGIFGLIGILILMFYFNFHLTSTVSILWMALVFAIGLGLVVLDGKLLNDGTFGLIGLLIMLTAVALPSPTFLYGLLVSSGFLLGATASFLFLKVFKPRKMWTKMTLKDRLSGELGYNSMNTEYKDLVGQVAKTITPFRPSGTIEMNSKKYDAVSDGRWINEGSLVTIIAVDGTRIVVEERETEGEMHNV